MQNKYMTWAGWAVSALVSLPLAFGAMLNLFSSAMAQEMNRLGMPPHMETIVGCLMLLCLLCYWFSPTAVLGAILFTGFMGGAILAHLRIGDPPVVQVAFPVLIWLGLWLRAPRLRALMPFNKQSPATRLEVEP